MSATPTHEPGSMPGGRADGVAEGALPLDDHRFRGEPPKARSKLVFLVVAGFVAAMILVGAGVTVTKGWIRDYNAQRELKRKEKEQLAKAEQRRASKTFAAAASAGDNATPEPSPDPAPPAKPATALPANFGASAPVQAGAIPWRDTPPASAKPAVTTSANSPQQSSPGSQAAARPPVSVMMLGPDSSTASEARPATPRGSTSDASPAAKDDSVAAYKARMDALQAQAAGRVAPPAAPAAPAAPNANTAYPIPRSVGRGTVQDFARINAARTSITSTPQAQAARLGDRSLLLARGATIPCVLQTQLYSNVPGASNCVVPEDVYSDDGRTVLIEKGSTFAGSYQSGLRNGDSRIAVVWHRLKTTDGVVVDVDAGAADGVGTMGLAGEVDHHWGQRIGAAFLLSLIDDVVSIEVARQSNGATTTGRATSTADTTKSMSEQMLSSTINIPPTITKNRGSRLAILVQRDLWFDNVYALIRRRGPA